MPKMQILGGDELKKLRQGLTSAAKESEELAKYALYDAAGAAADAIRKGLDGLRVVSDAEAIQAYKRREPTLICATQRDCLYYALGITPMRSRGGSVTVRAGFTNTDPVRGYNTIVTKRWPNGQPQIIIAASCEHGSSAMLEQPFIRPAFEKNREKMEQLASTAAQRWIRDTLDGKTPPRNGRTG